MQQSRKNVSISKLDPPPAPAPHIEMLPTCLWSCKAHGAGTKIS